MHYEHNHNSGYNKLDQTCNPHFSIQIWCFVCTTCRCWFCSCGVMLQFLVLGECSRCDGVVRSSADIYGRVVLVVKALPCLLNHTWWELWKRSGTTISCANCWERRPLTVSFKKSDLSWLACPQPMHWDNEGNAFTNMSRHICLDFNLNRLSSRTSRLSRCCLLNASAVTFEILGVIGSYDSVLKVGIADSPPMKVFGLHYYRFVLPNKMAAPWKDGGPHCHSNWIRSTSSFAEKWEWREQRPFCSNLIQLARPRTLHTTAYANR